MRINTISEQGSGKENEDRLILGKSVFGVVDGATSLNGEQFENGKTGGWIAAEIITRTFEADESLPLFNKGILANQSLNSAMLTAGVDLTQKANRWSASFAVIKLGGENIEWVQTGDCVILAIYRDGTYKTIVDGLNHDRDTLIKWKKVAGASVDPIHMVLKDQIRKVREATNVTYGALNGESAATHFVRQGKEPLAGIRDLVLFTDGLQIPRECPSEVTDFGPLVRRLQASGLSSLKEHIRELENMDPSCVTYPRFKTHDDIAAVSISFG